MSVIDTGDGIDPAFLPHMFEAFRQAEAPNTRVHGGLGLGLSIVRYLAEAHGGTVTAESEGKGRGATFTVTLPTGSSEGVRQREEPPAVAEQGEEHGGARLSGVVVLLVEDDPDSRGLFREMLRRAGAEVTAVDSAARALAAFAARRYGVVVTDIAMPTMDGTALARALRASPGGGEVKIIALSAFVRGRAQDGLFDTWLSKPIEPEDFIEGIARIAEV
jgi:CheY-like chemotaxis protein